MTRNMRIDILSIFPEMFSPLNQSIVGKAQDKGILELHTHDFRENATNKQRHVDDMPYRMPIVVSHGEGRTVFASAAAEAGVLAAVRFVDNHGRPAETYPFNPNGSTGGLTGVTTPDGRFTILMPHPERTARAVQMSWYPAGFVEQSGDASPWLRMFRNARAWVG